MSKIIRFPRMPRVVRRRQLDSDGRSIRLTVQFKQTARRRLRAALSHIVEVLDRLEQQA